MFVVVVGHVSRSTIWPYKPTIKYARPRISEKRNCPLFLGWEGRRTLDILPKEAQRKLVVAQAVHARDDEAGPTVSDPQRLVSRSWSHVGPQLVVGRDERSQGGRGNPLLLDREILVS